MLAMPPLEFYPSEKKENGAISLIEEKRGKEK